MFAVVGHQEAAFFTVVLLVFPACELRAYHFDNFKVVRRGQVISAEGGLLGPGGQHFEAWMKIRPEAVTVRLNWTEMDRNSPGG